MLITNTEMSLLVASLAAAKDHAKQHADDCDAIAKKYNVHKSVICKIAAFEYSDNMDKLRKTVHQFDKLLNLEQMVMEFDGTGSVMASSVIGKAMRKGGDATA